MSDILDLHLEHFVKVKVRRIKNQAVQKGTPCETFTLDPLTINFSILRNLLARIFHIEGEFTVSFKKDKAYIPLTSDWDLDGALHEASKPHLSLGIELQPIDKTFDEWDIICPADIPLMEQEVYRSSEDRKSLAGSILSQMETAFCKVQRAFSFDSSSESLGKLQMDEIQYNNLLDRKGKVINHRDLHMSVYRGGVEPSLRPEVWQHLLNVYPHGMTFDERKVYLNAKCEEYYHLRHRWQHLMQAGTIPDVLYDITNMVRKDVRRTDRTEKFYSGSDDSGNVRTLFNILTTYAVNHPNVSYCQGMSDLLSPILYVMKRESVAYVCFCGLMKRTHTNFKLDGRSMKLKFRHLQKMLRFYDQELYVYLKEQDALDLLFCYRWLLLELKREFPYNEMLNLMEVVWASLPPKPPLKELHLYDVKFPTAAICNSLKDRTRAEDCFPLVENHFAESDRNSFSQSLVSNSKTKQVKKWELRVRRESMAMDDTNEISSEAEIRLPVHYRQRKYRSYIIGKLQRLNKDDTNTEMFASCKIPERKNSVAQEICQSWSCGEKFEEKKEVRDALYEAREFLRNQWCYSNTVNEIQLNNWLNNKTYEKLKIMTCGIGGKIDETRESRSLKMTSDTDLGVNGDNYDHADEHDLVVSCKSNDLTDNSTHNSTNNNVVVKAGTENVHISNRLIIKNNCTTCENKGTNKLVNGTDVVGELVSKNCCNFVANEEDRNLIVNNTMILNNKYNKLISNKEMNIKSDIQESCSTFNQKPVDQTVHGKVTFSTDNDIIVNGTDHDVVVEDMDSDATLNGDSTSEVCPPDNSVNGVVSSEINGRHRHGSNDSSYSTISDDLSDEELSPKSTPSLTRRSQSEGYMSDSETNTTPLVEDEDYDSEGFDDEYSDDGNEFLDSMAGQQYEEVQTYFDRKKEMLPPPDVLGDGNPFLLFLCIAMIQCHRNEIFRRRLDFNELGIYFDKLVRKHKLSNVLSKAQKMFKEYLNMGWDVEDGGEVSDDLEN